MDGIFFLFLAFLTSIVSIKLSKYGDILSKQSKIGAMFIGGLLIASITSLPEFVTSVSASLIDNPSLSLGDILGSNLFNVFALAIFNIIFLNKKVLKKTSTRYVFECFILLVDFLFIFLACKKITILFSSIMLIIFYTIYMFSVFNDTNDSEEDTYVEKDKYVILKFICSGVFMIILSIFLTLQADRISRTYPNFSSSSIGAILLGVTTSLPEVVTTFELLRLNNFNMAISNILGSNIFNFLVLAVSDLMFKNGSIYSYVDKYSYLYLYGGIIVTLFLMLTIFIKNKKNIFYFIFSFLIVLVYFVIWYLQFV